MGHPVDKSYLLFIILFTLFGCSDRRSIGEISYHDQIQESIFKFSCSTAVCHDASSQGGLNLTSYATLMQGGDNGFVVQAGSAEASPLIWSLEGRDPVGNQVNIMPPLGLSPLLMSEINIIKDWIDQGAKDN